MKFVIQGDAEGVEEIGQQFLPRKIILPQRPAQLPIFIQSYMIHVLFRQPLLDSAPVGGERHAWGIPTRQLVVQCSAQLTQAEKLCTKSQFRPRIPYESRRQYSDR